ncbi:MAG: hypothetical protein AAF960_18210 [Bacteroidota bacterium]
MLLVLNSSLTAQLDASLTKQKRAQSIADNLVGEGFQSIDIYQQDKVLTIAYENRVYRFDALGLREVMAITKQSLDGNWGDIEQLVFITKRANIPMLQTDWHLTDNKGGMFTDASVSRTLNRTNLSNPLVRNQNSGNFRAELVLRPYLSMELGNLYVEDQFIHLIDLRPKLNLYLWKGAHFTYEMILPISNEFQTAPHWSEVRPRVVSLTQQFRLPATTFLNISAGLFSRNRYGVSTQFSKYFLDSRIRLSGKIGYTGHASYVRYNGIEVDKNWVYTDLDYIDYKIGMHYWLPKFNTQIGVEYGKVLNEERTIFFRCMQKFKEIDLGFYAYRTESGENYGIDLAIPIFPKKYWKPKRVSVRPSKRFAYNYLSGARRGSGIILAREYQAQGMFDDFPQDLNPHFIRNYLSN